MVLHGVGKRLAVDDAVREILAHETLRGALITLVGQSAEGLPERHARLQKIGKLAREEENVGLLHHGLFARLCRLCGPSGSVSRHAPYYAEIPT